MRPIWATLLMALFLALAPAAFANTTWYVNGTTGSDDNDCKSPTTACKTIGHAISLATSGDSIMVAAATYTENLTIGVSLKVMGASAETTIIDGGGHGTVVSISNSTANVGLSRLTVRNGSSLLTGGGINSSGILTINNSTISGNGVLSSSSCKIGCTVSGGGISNSGTLIINNSTVSGNTVSTNQCESHCTATGGGISNSGTLTINNSTLSGNIAGCSSISLCGGHGGGINTSPAVNISNSTISDNSAAFDGGGIWGAAILQNSIVASNSGGNCSGSMTSNGYNLSSDASCNFSGPGDLNNTDPKLGPLQNNGGQTQTQALLSGSPAIDAGNPNGCTDGNGNLLKTDQRGAPRPDKEDTGGCDMGAYERQSD